jgi:hypothetical protein
LIGQQDEPHGEGQEPCKSHGIPEIYSCHHIFLQSMQEGDCDAYGCTMPLAYFIIGHSHHGGCDGAHKAGVRRITV